jgi:AcrR family transcriptional regulator
VEGGVVRPATPRALQKRVTREQIVAAATKLLSFRDPEHITVAVIAAAAGASRSAFYRHFHSEHEALSSALASMIDELIRDLPPLAQPQNLEEARGLLRSWCEAFAQSIEQHAALKRALRQDRSGRQRVRFDLSCATQSAAEILSEFFRRIDDAGLAPIDDPLTLARAIQGVHVSSCVATMLTAPGHELQIPPHEDVQSLIERAVFGAQRRFT